MWFGVRDLELDGLVRVGFAFSVGLMLGIHNAD
jgi:hypothetical protein